VLQLEEVFKYQLAAVAEGVFVGELHALFCDHVPLVNTVYAAAQVLVFYLFEVGPGGMMMGEVDVNMVTEEKVCLLLSRRMLSYVCDWNDSSFSETCAHPNISPPQKNTTY